MLAVSVLFVLVGVVSLLGGSSTAGGSRVVLATMGAAFAVVGVVLVVRAPRVAVRLSDDELRYDGFLLSWSAPRRQVTTVLDDAVVEWRDDHGVEHRRQIWLLTQAWEDDGTRFARLWRWRREGLLQVRAWADARAC